MNKRPSYVKKNQPARGSTLFFRVAAPFFALILAACASSPEPRYCRTEYRSYPRPVFIGVPERYIEPLQAPELPEDIDNRALEGDQQALETLLDQCQSDRAELRRLNQQRGQGGD